MMSREHFGLVDTPPGRREYRFAAVAAGTLFAGYLAILPFITRPVGAVGPFVPVVDAVVSVGELIIATMLYAQAAIFRTRSLTVMASGFVLIAVLAIAHALTFPGAFAPNGLLGAGINTTAWIMIFRRLAFPLAVILYVIWARRDLSTLTFESRSRERVMVWAASAIALGLVLITLAVRGSDLLPQMSVNKTDSNLTNLTIYNFCNIALILAAGAVLWRKPRSLLDVWLMVALTGWLIQSLLNLPVHTRFTLGWYALYLVVFVSHLLVLFALIGEANRVYAQLVLSMAARKRERDARMMTMDAVAATISHEVGQPLAAIGLSATAALQSLSLTPPDYEMATRSLRDIAEAGNRTFDVLRSVRTTYGRGSGSLSEFDLNELILEAAALLSREFTASRISLQLLLGKGLPPIVANRVQMHRVLVNLLTNAIESIEAAQRRTRRITIRSTKPDSENVLLEITDSGAGISPENLDRIFDPFFTTKSTGTGLGLSLCSTIVEEHGGRLWATSKDLGATLHLRMRRKPLPDEIQIRIA